MNFKEGVSLKGLQAPLLLGLIESEKVYMQRLLPMWVTSLNDGEHSPTSLHPKGLAADLRTRGTGSATSLLGDLKKKLNPLGFDVILEDPEGNNEHIHLEYDSKETLDKHDTIDDRQGERDEQGRDG
jgi:hypothetical protein